MRAMLLFKPQQRLQLVEVPTLKPSAGQVLARVSACAVCRTDLHVVDGELPNPKVPLVPGHEIVGRIAEIGPGVERFQAGDRIGIPWLGWACGECEFCRSGRENLCNNARFTGYTLDGGYAEYTVADARFCFPIPHPYSDAEAAPLLCAGLIGYRSLLKAGNAKRLGIYGFGSAAHIVAQVARHQGRRVFAFTRPGDLAAQEVAKSLGAVWAGDSNSKPPEELDAAIIFAPVGELVLQALQAVTEGGTVVCGGIHMSDIPTFPCELLYGRVRGVFGCQSDSSRWRRVSRPGAERAGAHRHSDVFYFRSERSALALENGTSAGRGRAGNGVKVLWATIVSSRCR